MKVKKILAVLLSCTFVASALAGCGEAQESTEQKSEVSKDSVEESSSAAESTPVSEEVKEFDPKSITEGVKLTIAAPENAKIEDYNTNEMTLKIEEDLGVDLEFVTFPKSDYADKLNVMVNGGDTLPDIIFDPPKDGYVNWANEEAIIPLNEYYDNPDYSKNIRAGSESTGVDIISNMTLADGTIYALPKLLQSPGSEVYIKLWVYEPWLEVLGKEMPTTTEEFYEICKLIAETDLNGNGKADEIGYVGYSLDKNSEWFKYLMNPFVYSGDSEYRVLEDGQISFAYTSDAWKEGLKYIKKFFDEGLIPEQVLTQDKAGYESLLYAEEQVVFAFTNWYYQGSDQQRRSEYTHVSALLGPAEEYNGFNGPKLPYAAAVISADCENPDAAFLVLDYMCEESFSISSRWGKQGQDWDYWEDAKIDDKSKYIPEYEGSEMTFIAYDDTSFWGGSDVQNRSYLQAGPLIVPKTALFGKAMLAQGSTPEEELKILNTNKTNKAIIDGNTYARKEVVTTIPLTVEETDQVSDIKATLGTYVIEMTSAFLTGNKDIDADWDAYIAELEKIGYEEILEVYQAAYDRLYK